MLKISEITTILPKMLYGDELENALKILPDYDEDIVKADRASRLIALSDIYSIYIPSEMSVEIYNKLYLALVISLRKKGLNTIVKQQNENYKRIIGKEHSGIIGGADSFTIIGTSGIGKSSAIQRTIEVITKNTVIKVDEPYTKIIPCLTVQCPFDCSSKGLLLEILRKTDDILSSSYYEKAIRTSSTIDILIGSVSNVAINHIGLLIVDEIQNVCNHRQGKSLIAMLTQLINNSGISICMVGVPESIPFFEQALHLARRSTGLEYTTMNYDMFFVRFCKTLFQYQYINNPCEISDGIIEWLYEHSGGMVSAVISIIHDAQEIAILEGSEKIDIYTLNKAYDKRLAMIHTHLKHTKKVIKNTSSQNPAALKTKNTMKKEIEVTENVNDIIIEKLAKKAKKDNLDMVMLLKEYITVDEVVL